MSIQKNKPEQIVTVLRQIEVQMANGKTVPQACKEAGIHTQTSSCPTIRTVRQCSDLRDFLVVDDEETRPDVWSNLRGGRIE